jgi:hypothetical protein
MIDWQWPNCLSSSTPCNGHKLGYPSFLEKPRCQCVASSFLSPLCPRSSLKCASLAGYQIHTQLVVEEADSEGRELRNNMKANEGTKGTNGTMEDLQLAAVAPTNPVGDVGACLRNWWVAGALGLWRCSGTFGFRAGLNQTVANLWPNCDTSGLSLAVTSVGHKQPQLFGWEIHRFGIEPPASFFGASFRAPKIPITWDSFPATPETPFFGWWNCWSWILGPPS